MEAKLKTDAIQYLKKRAETAFTHEETAEIIVPDALPDIMDILDTQGTIVVKSKEAAMGKMIFSGTVIADVLYRPEDEDEGELGKLEIAIPFTAEAEASEVTQDSLLYSKVDIGYLDARMINSRKALVRVDVLIMATAYQSEEFRWSGGIEDGPGGEIHSLMSSAELSFVTQLREKTFVLADEFELPAGKAPIEQFYKTHVQISSEEVKGVGNKLIFKGNVQLDILYKGEGEREPQILNFSAPFSQIIEMESDTEDAEFSVELMTTNCFIENGGSMAVENAAVAIELHLVAQAVCRRKYSISYISDVHSTKFDLNEQMGELLADNTGQALSIDADSRETVELPAPVQRIIDSRFTVGKVFCTVEDGVMTMTAPVCAAAMYMTQEGRICSVSRRFEVTGNMDSIPGMKYFVSACVLGEAQAIAMGDSIEFYMPVRFEVTPGKEYTGSNVTGISWNEDEPRDLSALPSLTVHQVNEGETLWIMAKKYCSTEELIVAVNGLELGAEPEAGSMFIIPSKK